MTLRALAAALAMGMAFTLRADGDSGEALRTPLRYKNKEIVENDVAATFGLASANNVKKLEERDGWGDGGPATCYARRDGVGLRASGEDASKGSALQKVFATPECVTYVAVTVSAATKDAAKDPELELTLRLRDDLAPTTQTFSFEGKQSSPKTLCFTFPEGVEAEYLRLSNPGEHIFEVERVVWKRHAPAIEGTLVAPASTMAGKSFHCSLASLSGGSGTYVRARFEFAGQSKVQEPVSLSGAVTFIAPAEDGDHPLTVTVEDDIGTAVTFVQTIHVVAYAPPRNLRATGLSRTGFTLEWDRPVLSPTEYRVTVRETAAEGMVSARFRPRWVADVEGRFVTEAPLAPLEGDIILTFPGWEGDALEWSAEGSQWHSVMNLSGLWFPTGWEGDKGCALWLRATSTEAPTSVRADQTATRICRQVIKAADGQRCAASFADLPAGCTLEATVSANYASIVAESEPLKITLEAIPPFVGGTWADGCATLTWPEGTEGLEAEMVIRAEREVPHTLPPGLYLTRTCFTVSKEGFSAGKGFVLTNTNTGPIALDGHYRLSSAKAAGKASVWDFSTTLDGKKVYPYVVPAGGELAFSHGTYALPEMREGVVTNTHTVLNFTPERTLTLLRDDAPINALGCATNAVRRLREDTLNAYDDHTLLSDNLDMAPFYDAWAILSEVEIHATMGIPPAAPGNRQSYLWFDPRDLVQDFGHLRRIWADFAILDGASRSKPLTLELWRCAPLGPKRGFILHLR